MTQLTDEPIERREHVHIVDDQPDLVREHHVIETPVREERVIYETSPAYEERRIVHDVAAEERQWLNKATQFIWLMAGIVEAAIALRVFLKLIAANPNSGFARLVYGVTDLLLWPFLGLTVTPTSGGMVLEIPSLIAMVVYAVVFYVLVKLLWLLFERPSARSVSTYKRH